MFTTRPYQLLGAFSLFMLFSDEPEVFLPKYSQQAILPSPHFWWVVNLTFLEVFLISDHFRNTFQGWIQDFEGGGGGVRLIVKY